MLIRYKLNNDEEWKAIESSKFGRVLLDMSRFDRVEVALACNHSETWVDGGVRICKLCREHLEVTSFRP